ncbi:methyltransferase domain-containing protein [Aquibium sp. LZ166]|uniref:Methyltransferase domain-containing protein n=1 Tax=Aquibium pacificus TaxID=3153579 RepID=A0ABV3SUB8_9HYPH
MAEKTEVPSDACRRIVLCGFETDSLSFFADLIRLGSQSPTKRTDRSAAEVSITADRTVISVSCDDLFRLRKLGRRFTKSNEDWRTIILVGDPRQVLRKREQSTGAYAIGYDRSLDISAAGIVTYSSPGLLRVSEAIRLARTAYPERTLVVRCEDIDRDPELIRHALSSFTGLPMRRPFSGLLQHPKLSRRPWPSLSDWQINEKDAARLVRQFRLAPELNDLREEWGYAARADLAWLSALGDAARCGFDDTQGTIFCYHTDDTFYASEVARLRRSVEVLGLKLDITVVPPTQDWLSAVRLKPIVLLEARKRIRGPLLYIDSDAIVHRTPWPYLRGYCGDIAVAGHPRQAIISGTIFLNDTEGAIQLLEEWIAVQDANPDHWDQHSLEHLVLRHGKASGPHRIEYLPPELCRVFDRVYPRPIEPIEPIIEHLQASRERFAGETEVNVNLTRRRQRIAEVDALYISGERRSNTLRLLASRGTDVTRWSEPTNLLASWTSRAQKVARLIEPGEIVLDIGCGAMTLESELPEGCTYIPADLVKRDERTLPCDLNAGRVPDRYANVVTMIGVFEYCHSPESVLAVIARRWPRLVLTYNPADLDGGRDRLRHGWFNALSSAAVLALAQQVGFRLRMIVPLGRERIYDLEIVP